MVKSKKASGLVEAYNGLTNTEPEPPGSEHKPLPDFDAKYPASSWYVGKGGVRGSKGKIPAGSRVVAQDFPGEDGPDSGRIKIFGVPDPQLTNRVVGQVGRILFGFDHTKTDGHYAEDDVARVAAEVFTGDSTKADLGRLAAAMALIDVVNGRSVETPA